MSDFVHRRVMELFGGGKLYCAETVLRVMAEAGGREHEDLVRMATGFCSGQARTCGQCGAVAGAMMGLGLYAGRADAGQSHEPVYALVKTFLARFSERYGSDNCAELLGCDLGTRMGQAKFKLKGLQKDCLEYSIFAAEVALDLLRESGHLSEADDRRAQERG